MYTLLSQRADISPVWFPTVPMRFPKRSKGRHCDNSSLFKTSQNQFKPMQNSCFSNTVFFPFQLKTFRTFSLPFLLSVRINQITNHRKIFAEGNVRAQFFCSYVTVEDWVFGSFLELGFLCWYLSPERCKGLPHTTISFSLIKNLMWHLHNWKWQPGEHFALVKALLI